MSTQVFPTLTGIGYPIPRRPVWDTTKQQNVSGKETRLGNFTFPLYQWDLVYNAIRQGSVHGTAYTELATLMGFYNARQGSFDSFLFTDPDDNSVTTQSLGTGDGTTLAFQLVRTFGGFVEPVLAPNAVSNVRVNGVLKTVGTDYSISSWGSTTPGIITFVVAPGNTLSITCDMTYYFPCRFVDDEVDFNKWISNMYEVKKLSIQSVKN